MATSQGEPIDLTEIIDMHVHSAPDVRPRLGDDIDMVRAATKAGMRGVFLKSHITLTADRAAIAEKVVCGARAFGGLALNAEVGGFNPAAVEAAIRMGAKQVWMPTTSSTTNHRLEGRPGGLGIFDPRGDLRPEIHEILELIRQADIILGTGHLAVEEIVALVKLARSRGLRKILVTHPEYSVTLMPVGIQREIAGEGVFFERCYTNDQPRPGVPGAAEIAAQIRQVGVESTVLATDFGVTFNPAPVEGIRAYLADLRTQGFGRKELVHMGGENAAYLLGL